MSRDLIQIDAELYRYFQEHSLRESDLLRRLREQTHSMPMARMQISPEQGQLMYLIVRLMGAQRILEIGVFTGYSSICLASGLPTDGLLVACDVSDEYTAIARGYWREAGLEQKITLRLAPATETIEGLLQFGEAGSFDIVFIDADKENYDTYYERALLLLRPGGLVMIDNTLWGGSVVDTEDTRESTVNIRALNEKIHADERVEISLLPIGDGLTLARKLG